MLSIPRQPSNASLLSSSRSLASSLLPASAASTAPSSVLPAASHPTPQPLAPSTASDPLKASTIHLPLALPGPGRELEEVDLRALKLQGELADAPVGFLVNKLRAMGPTLLKATTATALHIPSTPDLPKELPCTFPVLRGDGVEESRAVLLPSHLLAIHAQDSPRTLLLPVHGLLYAALSPLLACLAGTHNSSETDTLPILHLNLPSATAIPLLQGWAYLRSRDALLAGLLPKPPATHPTDTDISRQPGSPPPTTATLSERLSHLPASKLLQHVQLVHGLWGVVCALGIADPELWGVMRFGWAVVVGALVLNERRRAEGERAQ